MTERKKIVVLCNGYPRLSQTYQIDEVIELSKRHELLIFSWLWPIYIAQNNAPASIFATPKNHLDKITEFNPDAFHGHFMFNLPLINELCIMFNKKFTLRAHSFDILDGSYKKHVNIVNSERCAGIFVFHEFVDKLISEGFHADKLHAFYPSIYIDKYWINTPNGQDIMSGGACLPKKNIPGFIELAAKIKKLFPEKKITYYTVQEDPRYFKNLQKINASFGNPVIFKTVQNEDMPLEYKKHQWLIYDACPILKTVGNPLMVAEAQAAGVGVIMYDLRPGLHDYVTENGYFFKTHDEVLEIIKNNFDEEKRQAAIEISKRYDIRENIKVLENLL